MFHQLDLDRNQKISKNELRRGLVHYRWKVTDLELDELWALLDTDNSGDVDYQEFVAIGKLHTDVKNQLEEKEKDLLRCAVSLGCRYS